MTSKGDILFWSQRVGAERIIFNMPKFRTMRIDAPNIATHLMDKPELFYTPIGKFLRSSSLDELPQLSNVIKCEMSVVGPRPLFDDDTKTFNKSYMRRLNVMPGMTGLLQINDRNTNDFEVWYKYDVEYIENHLERIFITT